MDFTNLKSGNGYINQQDIVLRLSRWANCSDCPPFVMRRCGDFSEVGIPFRGETYSVFKVYTGHRDLYLYIRDMVQEAAEGLGIQLEWEEYGIWTSEEALRALNEAIG